MEAAPPLERRKGSGRCRALVGVQFRVKMLSRDFRYIAARAEGGWEISGKHERPALLLRVSLSLSLLRPALHLPVSLSIYLSTDLAFAKESTRRLFPPSTRPSRGLTRLAMRLRPANMTATPARISQRATWPIAFSPRSSGIHGEQTHFHGNPRDRYSNCEDSAAYPRCRRDRIR